MQISWAAFGERNAGHALLATSDNHPLASKLIQYTDRPGDPPFNQEWGPVISGFCYEDHYILLRTMQDPDTGRAGMVRSYAAFIDLQKLSIVECLASIFAALPIEIISISSTLPPLTVDDNLLSIRNIGAYPL